MGVQAAIAFLNGNETASIASAHPGKRPIPPKSTTSSWTAKPASAVNLPDKKKDNTLANTKINNTTTATATAKAAVAETTTSRHTHKSRAIVDMLTAELTTQYQEALDKNDSAKEIINKLESDVELYACDSTKVRDYEIRVEYLAQKLEQVSEERDLLEQELSTYKDRHGNLATPVSPAFGPDVFGGKTTMIEAVPTTTTATHQKNNMNQQHNETSNNNDSFEKQHQQQQQRLEDIYFDEILDAYEERRSEDNDDMVQQQEHNEQMMAQMLAEYDQGMKMAMETYVADLEKQRLENKTLQSMVKKQDELIKKLETQYGVDHPSDESGEQRLSQQRQQRQQRTSPSYRSSIDVLAEMARNESVLGSSSSLPLNSIQHHHQRDTGRNTPPPFAPPKTPLPPLPITDQSNTSVNNDSLISYSRSSTSSTTWSSDEQEHHHQQHQNQHQQHHQHQHPLSTMTTGLPPKHNTIDDHHHADHTSIVDGDGSLNNGATSGSFWNGLRKKF
ncbi:hypothetical protein BCR42DRAFT_413497 [Absidia repens]|uniref:Uncharacterized protein n=1 Tax=Absidia repens TaxID=90262 RepID=A0A1X2II04_9FUNG|nr:hypothetical protein BCR42DRAFT_413497 [Absidia repens]